jgi:hypothetical protein
MMKSDHNRLDASLIGADQAQGAGAAGDIELQF